MSQQFPELRCGDEFAVCTDRFFGRLINIRQRLQAADREATYNHCGIIKNAAGDTFESRRRIDNYNLFKMYAGRKIIIMRPNVPQETLAGAIAQLEEKFKGRVYPWWRIVLHILSPALARDISLSGIPVCSELQGFQRFLIGVRHKYYMGSTPDLLVDEARHWREYSLPYEDTCPESLPPPLTVDVMDAQEATGDTPTIFTGSP